MVAIDPQNRYHNNRFKDNTAEVYPVINNEPHSHAY